MSDGGTVADSSSDRRSRLERLCRRLGRPFWLWIRGNSWLELRKRETLYWRWAVASRFGSPTSLDTKQRLTVIMAVFEPGRRRNIAPLIRSILKCDFVDKVIVTNNNPEVDLLSRLAIKDKRLTLLTQATSRGPGFVWKLASREPADYFLVVDDDTLICPRQVAALFNHLLEEPGIPHGLAGQSGPTYMLSADAEVEILYMVYAVTRLHVERYLEYFDRICARADVSPAIVERWCHDQVMSRTGDSRPRIHAVGQVLECRTSDMQGVALHHQDGFELVRSEVRRALDELLPATKR